MQSFLETIMTRNFSAKNRSKWMASPSVAMAADNVARPPPPNAAARAQPLAHLGRRHRRDIQSGSAAAGKPCSDRLAPSAPNTPTRLEMESTMMLRMMVSTRAHKDEAALPHA